MSLIISLLVFQKKSYLIPRWLTIRLFGFSLLPLLSYLFGGWCLSNRMDTTGGTRARPFARRLKITVTQRNAVVSFVWGPIIGDVGEWTWERPCVKRLPIVNVLVMLLASIKSLLVSKREIALSRPTLPKNETWVSWKGWFHVVMQLAYLTYTSFTVQAAVPKDASPDKLVPEKRPKLISLVEYGHREFCHLCGSCVGSKNNLCTMCSSQHLEREIERCREILKSTYKNCSLDLDTTFILCYCCRCTSKKLASLEVDRQKRGL